MSKIGQVILNSLLVGRQQKTPQLRLMLGGLYESNYIVWHSLIKCLKSKVSHLLGQFS